MNPENTTPKVLRVCRIAVYAALLMLPLAPLATHAGLLPWPVGLALTALAVVESAVLLVVLLALLLWQRFRAFAPAILLLAGLATVPVGIAAFVVVPTRSLPVIHDISTDLADPPVFGERTLALRGADSNPVARDADEDAAQRAAYPQLAGIDSSLAAADALARSAEIAQAIGWELTASDAATGLLEARETTFWFGFVDDVAVRVRPTASGSRIDLRSVSRVGRGDLGANAARIERFRAAWREREPGSGSGD